VSHEQGERSPLSALWRLGYSHGQQTGSKRLVGPFDEICEEEAARCTWRVSSWSTSGRSRRRL